ncbi:MAG: (d)CMP kinase [Thermoleophilia bacterium]|nr:(d)CMP kinase [Thermoleophilia bacterium]
MTVVAIDGPGGSGKSTVARRVAASLGFVYLDTGAMYRAVGVLAHEAGLDLSDEAAVAAVAATAALRFDDEGRLFAGERDLSAAIRTLAAGEAASRVSALPAVRRLLVERQRALAAGGDVVIEGRDIGTNVCPRAELKVYLTASANVRSRRRYDELTASGHEVAHDEVSRAVEERDRRDTTRAVNPLRKADDAVEIDTSELTLDEVVAAVERLARERLAR